MLQKQSCTNHCVFRCGLFHDKIHDVVSKLKANGGCSGKAREEGKEEEEEEEEEGILKATF